MNTLLVATRLQSLVTEFPVGNRSQESSMGLSLPPTENPDVTQDEHLQIAQALVQAADLPATQISAAAANVVFYIKDNLVKYRCCEAAQVFRKILNERAARLYDARHAHDFDYCGSKSVEMRFVFDGRAESKRDYFDWDARPWKDIQSLRDVPEKIFRRDIDLPTFSIDWNPKFSVIKLTSGNYGTSEQDLRMVLLGYPGVLKPLPGVQFVDPVTQAAWEKDCDSRPFLKNGKKLQWNSKGLPGFERTFQKVYPIQFEHKPMIDDLGFYN